MTHNIREHIILTIVVTSLAVSGCTLKAVGDPERPITIQAHVTIDIRGLENTATNIEDFVSGEKSLDSLTVGKGGSDA